MLSLVLCYILESPGFLQLWPSIRSKCRSLLFAYRVNPIGANERQLNSLNYTSWNNSIEFFTHTRESLISHQEQQQRLFNTREEKPRLINSTGGGVSKIPGQKSLPPPPLLLIYIQFVILIWQISSFYLRASSKSSIVGRPHCPSKPSRDQNNLSSNLTQSKWELFSFPLINQQMSSPPLSQRGQLVAIVGSYRSAALHLRQGFWPTFGFVDQITSGLFVCVSMLMLMSPLLVVYIWDQTTRLEGRSFHLIHLEMSTGIELISLLICLFVCLHLLSVDPIKVYSAVFVAGFWGSRDTGKNTQKNRLSRLFSSTDNANSSTGRFARLGVASRCQYQSICAADVGPPLLPPHNSN